MSGPTDHPSTPPNVVYLASGLAFPDALAAGPAAIHLGGVVLLTDPTTLSPETKVELARLQPEKVIVVGSFGAVSNSVMAAAGVAAEVSAASGTLLRQAGPDRYFTADAIVQYAFTTNVYSSTAFIATGRNYPDALAAGPGAGLVGSPVILVDGNASSLPVASCRC